MSMVSLKPDFFGWEMLYKSIERVVMRKTDILIALAHFVMLKHARFLCLGIGEERTSGPENGIELLPDGWNYDCDKYILRYICLGDYFLLTGYKNNEAFIISLQNIQTREASKVTFDDDKIVQKIRGTITDLVPDAPKIAEQIRRELVDPVHPRLTNEITTQTNPKDALKCEDSDDENALPHKVKCMRINGPQHFCGKYLDL